VRLSPASLVTRDLRGGIGSSQADRVIPGGSEHPGPVAEVDQALKETWQRIEGAACADAAPDDRRAVPSPRCLGVEPCDLLGLRMGRR